MEQSSLGSQPCTSCVKIYLISNPEDSVVERRALRESVFPKLREHCRNTHGLDLMVTDPWESSDPSRWPDQRTRQQLIYECQNNSNGPFLLALVGHQYGKASLPSQVEVTEYQMLLQVCQQAGIATSALEEAYLRDENSIPPSYWLQARAGRSEGPVDSNGEVGKEDQRKRMDKGEEVLKVFQTALGLCVLEGLMTQERAHDYLRSVLDADLRLALQAGSGDDIMSRCLVYVHRIRNAHSQRSGNEPSDPDPDTLLTPHLLPSGDHFLSQLCDYFLPSLITSSQLQVYTTTTECDRHRGYTTARRRAYTESLCHQVYPDLVDLVNNRNPLPVRRQAHLDDALARELVGQQELSCIFSRLYDVTRPEEEEIKAYLVERAKQCPLVVGGGPCTGKTVLLAHCCQQVKSWLADQDPVIIPYFANLANNPSPKHFISILCYQIVCCYRQPHHVTSDLDISKNLPSNLESNHEPGSEENHHSNPNLRSSTDTKPKDPNPPEHRPEQSIPSRYFEPDLSSSWLKDHLSSLLTSFPTPKRPVVLILDGLDQINNVDQQPMVQCLPSPLPPCVKLILSVSNRHTQALQAIQLHYPECTSSPVLHSIVPTKDTEREGLLMKTGQTPSKGYGFVELKTVERKQCVRMVASLLSISGRRVTSGQQTLVNKALGSCSLIFYARLLHSHTLLWTSDSEVMESSLPNGVHASISALLDLLEQKHGPSLVRRCLSYLTLSRTGLTEAELTDLLSSDDEVLMMEYMLRGEAHSSRLRVPHVDVERLLLDLRMFLGRRTVVAGTRVLFWVCRHFDLVVTKKYLGCHELRKQLHSEMADYFNGLWAFGKAKPLIITRETMELGSSETNAASSETDKMAVYIDRQPPCQPFVFRSSDSVSSACKDVGLVNLRMILELPHHLQESERWKELEHKFLLSLGFQQAMVQAGLLGDLVVMLMGERRSQVVTLPRERVLLASILKSTACILQSSPEELPMLMETRLLPFVGVYPELEVYIKEIEQDRRRRGSGISVLLCPASSTLPSIQCSLSEGIREQSCINEVAVTACNVLVGVMESGIAWMWRSPWREVEELSLSNKQLKVKFSRVRSTGRRILLSTYCNMLFLLDVTSPEMSVEVVGPLKTEEFQGETDQQTHMVEGCVESEEHLCVWWKDKRSVCVFHGANSKPLTFQCQNPVTCLVCSTDGRYMYCGQETGAVAIFDIYNTEPVCECSNPNQNAIISIILCEEQWDMACVDITGNIMLWNVDGRQPQPAFELECCSGKSGNSILNMDYSYELATLLVCKAQQITVWNTCEWVTLGQFMTPQGKAFIHALLAQEGHLFLALLQSCSLVLVWKISSGECVLSLDTSSSASVPRLLKTASGFITITPHGCLSMWDSEVINAAGMPPKMSSGVRQVVADEVGERFYTADGSVAVWGWSLRTGDPEVNFIHDGPVEKLMLSPDNSHLVSVSGGDIYIWQLYMCQNSFRIRGSNATDILITPNSKFGVSLCERGISRVWNLQNGGVVCLIHLYLAAAKVSPESTFLIGLRQGDLLATNLWSGTVSKRFSHAEYSERVVAFHMLPQQPDFVLVMGSSGVVYTWKVTEDSVFQQFQLPRSFSGHQPHVFQTSSAGSFMLLSTNNDSMAYLDLSTHRICYVKVEGAGFAVCLDKAGRYAVCLSQHSAVTTQCFCDVHLEAALTVIRLADGGKVGMLRMCKMPSALAVCEQLYVYVGFHDGSVGVYSILDIINKQECSVRSRDNLIGLRKHCLCGKAPMRLLPLAFPNITWS